MIKIGVVGYGYWGPNIVRNFAALDGVEVVSVCDHDLKALARVKKSYRVGIKLVSDYRDVTDDPDLDAVAVVSPVFTHYEITRRALEKGKHVFVEKPFTSNSEQAKRLIEIAARRKLKLMVDHTLLFASSVRKIKEVIDGGKLGKLYYYDSTRVNLGLFQHDVNVIWDLAPHDLSIMDHVIKEKPAAILATGTEHFNRGLETIAYITVYFNSNLIAHFNVNWLSPVKVRTTLIGGAKKMLVWNDLAGDNRVRIYDRGVTVATKEGLYNLLVQYRSGDMWAPHLEGTEALAVETKYFIECITKNKRPINDGQAGLRIVKLLEASDRSLKSRGKLIKL